MSKRRKDERKRKRKKNKSLKPQPLPSARPFWSFAGALAASAAFGGLTTPAFAQEPSSPPGRSQAVTRTFDIQAGSLRDAINAFARTTGLVVLDPQALSSGLFTAGVTGSYSDEEALRRLLGASGIAYRFTNARTLRLQRVELPALAGGAVDTLPTIAVEGARERPSSPKYSAPLRDVPQSISIVPQRVMQAQGATSLRDVVRNVPGLTVNAGEGGATPGDNFNLRGFTARGDVFVDGVRSEGGYSRETFNVEQVEVTKGPGSAYIGRGSTGGAINLVTKTPRLARAYDLSAGVGTADFQRATADLNQPLEIAGLPGAAVRVNAEWQDAGVAGLDRVERNTWGIAPSVAVGLGTSTQLTLDYMHGDQDNTPSYGVQSQNTDGPPAVNTRRFFGLSSLDFERVNADRGNARVEHRFSETLTLRNQLSWGQEDVRRVVTFANLDATRATRSHISVDENLSNLTNLSTGFRTGRVEHAVSAGLEVSHESSYFGSYRLSAPPPSTDLNNPNPDDPYTGTLTEAPPRRDASANSLALYALETVKLGQRVELSAGLRYDYFDPTYRDTLGVDIAVPGGTESDAVSWRGGIVYKPRPEGSVYFAYGTSFNPSGERLAYDASGVSGLDPEKNRSFEVGTKWDLVSGRLSTTAAVFRTDKTNARIDDPSDPLGQRQVLAGRQRVDGAELGVTGTPVAGWSVFAGYTFLDSEILTSDDPAEVGGPLPNTPKHALNLWTTYRLPWELEIGGGARHVSRRVLSPTASVPPYWSFDAEASYPVAPRVLLRLNLYNLTDEIYYDHGRFWVPSPGRSVRVSTSLQY